MAGTAWMDWGSWARGRPFRYRRSPRLDREDFQSCPLCFRSSEQILRAPSGLGFQNSSRIYSSVRRRLPLLNQRLSLIAIAMSQEISSDMQFCETKPTSLRVTLAVCHSLASQCFEQSFREAEQSTAVGQICSVSAHPGALRISRSPGSLINHFSGGNFTGIMPPWKLD